MDSEKAKAPLPQESEAANQYTVLKLRLYPTPEQTELIEKTFGCCRYLWNKMLSDTQEFYAATDIHYIPTPARYKKEAPFLKEVDSQPLCCVHQNLRRAFMDFFRAPSVYGYPQFKRKSSTDSFTVYCRQYRTGPSISLNGQGIQLPKLGLIPANVYRKPPADAALKLVTVRRTGSGKYMCSVTFGYETAAPEKREPTKERTLGINFSLTRFYVDSCGNSPVLPPLKPEQEKLAEMQRKLSRMKRGSKNYKEQQQKIRLQYEHIANCRRDFIHKESRRIADAWDAVCVRETDLTELEQKLKQGGVRDYGFGAFRDCLKYKLERQGKAYIVLDQLAPAAKTCNECGNVNRQLDSHTRRWSCPACGADITREVNTARNIRDMGLEQLKNQKSGSPLF